MDPNLYIKQSSWLSFEWPGGWIFLPGFPVEQWFGMAVQDLVDFAFEFWGQQLYVFESL